MAERLSFDTTFLIDLQKEKRDGHPGPAYAFLTEHSDAGIFLSTIALGEFIEGFQSFHDAALLRILAALQILEIDQEVSFVYAENTRRLRRAGRLIGSNDLWIGSCAVRNRMPLVTRNANHFTRISQLEVIQY